MEASSTTENIGGTPEAVAPLKKSGHNHGPNFGRFKEGCPKCIEQHPNGPEAPKAKKVRVRSESKLAITTEEVAALLAAKEAEFEERLKAFAARPVESIVQAGLTNDQLMTLVTALREPTQEQLEDREKREKQKKRLAVVRQQMVDQAKLEEEQKAIREANCNHLKQNGTSARVMGQVYSDGFCVPFCQHCMKMWPKVRPNQQQMSMAVE